MMKFILFILFLFGVSSFPYMNSMGFANVIPRILTYCVAFSIFDLAGYVDYVQMCECVQNFESVWLLNRSRLLEMYPLEVIKIDQKLVALKKALEVCDLRWKLDWNPNQQRCWLELVDQFPGMVNGVGNDLVFIESSIKFIDTLSLAIV